MTPDQIRSREFFVSADGYDRAEVRRFLSLLADEREAAAWAAADERLLLVLEAARRAVDGIAEDARRATAELRQIVRDELRIALGTATPAPPPPGRGPEAETAVRCEPEVRVAGPPPAVEQVRERLEQALLDVERALGSLGG